MRRYLLLALLFASLAACGTKSQIRGGTPRRPSFDGGTSTDARIPGDLTVECGRRDRFTAPGRPLTVMATTTSDAPIVSEAWSVGSVPAGSVPALDTMGTVATLAPDLRGDYVLRFDASDADGNEGTCSVTVHAVVGPPVAICPEE